MNNEETMATTQVSGIETELGNMDNNLDRLEKTISRHSTQIDKVLLSGSEQKSPVDDSPVKSSSTPLAQVLRRQNDRFNSLINELLTLSDRVEL